MNVRAWRKIFCVFACRWVWYVRVGVGVEGGCEGEEGRVYM